METSVYKVKCVSDENEYDMTVHVNVPNNYNEITKKNITAIIGYP